MAPHTASLVNAVVLLVCSAWGYWATDFKSMTALIPAAFAVALFACYPGVRAENKLIAHIAVLLTFVLLVALYMPLSSALESGELGPIVRSVLMAVTTVFAMVAFIKSFRNARRARTPS